MSIYSKLRQFMISDPQWGDFKIMRPIVKEGEDSWGILAPLRGTPWGDQIPVVSGQNLSTALHGWATPLMNEIGPEPLSLIKQIQDAPCLRLTDKSCGLATSKCRPGPDLPVCYEAPPEGEISSVASVVALAWSEGRYVIVVEGDEIG